MQGIETAIYNLSVQRPQPHNTTLLKERKGSEQLGPNKSIGPALETRQSSTIEYMVSKIAPQRH